MKNPEDLHYTAEHLWVRTHTDSDWEAGITDYAQDLLGDIVFVDAPKLGVNLSQAAPCGLVESVKTGSDLHAPLNGVVTAVNDDLAGNPELLNDKPYKTWIFKFKPQNPADLAQLLSAQAYIKLIAD